MKLQPSLLFFLAASTLGAQGVYLNANKPGDALCPRVEQDKDPNIAFGQGGTGTGGKVGADATALLLYSAGHKDFPQGARKNVGKFSAVDQHGKVVNVADLKGKIVLVGLWSTSCEPSAKMLVEFADLYPKREKFGFELMSVNFDQGGWRQILPFMRKNKGFFEGDMPVYVPGIGDHGVSQFMDIVNSLPALFVIDREGNLASIHLGYEAKFVVNSLKHAIVEKSAVAPVAPSQPNPH